MRDSGSQSLIANPGELLVSVVLSFRNEAKTIPELIRRLLQVFDIRYQFILGFYFKLGLSRMFNIPIIIIGFDFIFIYAN